MEYSKSDILYGSLKPFADLFSGTGVDSGVPIELVDPTLRSATPGPGYPGLSMSSNTLIYVVLGFLALLILVKD